MPLLFIAAIMIRIDSKGPIIYWSIRSGKNNINFYMPKLRTMYLSAPVVATDKLVSPKTYITRLGRYLRKYSIDEIPQLFSILKGDMSFVGPRPALFNQYELINLRDKYLLNSIKPGLTGLAQINGRDNLSTVEKVSIDKVYMKKKGFFFDIYIIVTTGIKIFQINNILH